MNTATCTTLSAIFLIVALSNHSTAQERPVFRDPFPQSNPPDLLTTANDGLLPISFASMVKSMDIIIEGTYGELRRSFTFYGYDASGNVAQSPQPVPGQPLSQGEPMREYIIVPTNVLKGADFISNPLILRVAEMPALEDFPAYQNNREGKHLFFFTLNPDNTVKLDGSITDIKEQGNAYTFIHYYGSRRMIAFGPHGKAEFIDAIKSIVASETR